MPKINRKLSHDGREFLKSKILHHDIMPEQLKYTFSGKRVWAEYNTKGGFVTISLTTKEYQSLWFKSSLKGA